LEDPWWDREVDFSVFSSDCSVRGLADCLPVARGLSVRCEFFACSSSTCELARRSSEVSKFCGRRFGEQSAWSSRTVRAAPVARGPSEYRAQTVRSSRCASGASIANFGPSARGSQTVRPVSADSLPQPHGPSTWSFAGQLSPLLLRLCFRFRFVWGSFLGLVGPL
jgi:hypothetical protein